MNMSTKILIGTLIFLLTLTTVYTIIFCFKGEYPQVIFTTLVVPILGELIILAKLEIDKRDREWTPKQKDKNE